MSKLYLGKMNLSEIDKTKIFEGKTGKWIDVTIWVNDQPDKYGNDLSIEQSTKKGETKLYIGNAKEWNKGQKAEPKDETNQGKYQKAGKVIEEPENSNLPF